VPLSPSSIIWY